MPLWAEKVEEFRTTLYVDASIYKGEAIEPGIPGNMRDFNEKTESNNYLCCSFVHICGDYLYKFALDYLFWMSYAG